MSQNKASKQVDEVVGLIFDDKVRMIKASVMIKHVDGFNLKTKNMVFNGGYLAVAVIDDMASIVFVDDPDWFYKLNLARIAELIKNYGNDGGWVIVGRDGNVDVVHVRNSVVMFDDVALAIFYDGELKYIGPGSPIGHIVAVFHTADGDFVKVYGDYFDLVADVCDYDVNTARSVLSLLRNNLVCYGCHLSLSE